MAMGTRRRRRRQERLWVGHQELAKAPALPFYDRVNELFEAEQFDTFAEKECVEFYAVNNGRPSLTPGIYFQLLLVGYFERDRFGARDRLARGGFPGVAEVSKTLLLSIHSAQCAHIKHGSQQSHRLRSGRRHLLSGVRSTPCSGWRTWLAELGGMLA